MNLHSFTLFDFIQLVGMSLFANIYQDIVDNNKLQSLHSLHGFTWQKVEVIQFLNSSRFFFVHKAMF